MLTRSRVSLFVFSMIAGAASAQVAFTPLGLPPAADPQDPPFSDAYGVSDNGVVVGSQHFSGGGYLSFRWTSGGGRETINGLNPGSGIFARAITPDATWIVGENTGPGVAFRKNGAGAVESLGFSDPDLYDQSAGNDVSNDGQHVAGLLSRIEDGTYRMARWSQGSGWQNLGALSNDYESVGNTISGDGSIVAGYSVGNYFTAVKWTESGGLEALANPFGIESNSAVIAMAADGSKFVGQANNASNLSQATVWNADGTTLILSPEPGFDSGAAFGVSGDGAIIGGTFFIEGVGQDAAAFWTADGTAYNLQSYLESAGIDMTGWNLLAVTEVSQNGLYLTGRGYNPNGQLEAFLVQIPTPGAALPLIAGLIAVRRRRV